jgi:hypothetical protein
LASLKSNIQEKIEDRNKSKIPAEISNQLNTEKTYGKEKQRSKWRSVNKVNDCDKFKGHWEF